MTRKYELPKVYDDSLTIAFSVNQEPPTVATAASKIVSEIT